jgi:hypothetical protein
LAASDADLALEYDVLAFAGHSEYWSAEMYGWRSRAYRYQQPLIIGMVALRY